ncbi:TetR/AcrR family transcriptional regulator [Liquorilactobacillus satsumensis]|uniref:TetR/AcrR family transcriptional regulator n=1 Tax=Liquorilactobacillus satsumensis TaxID=259059 RepID=UPI0039EC952E
MNKKSANTQHQVEQALFQLMQAEKFDNISITTISEKAKVSRMSFYRNYTSKEDILNKFLARLYDKFLFDVAAQNLTQVTQLLDIYFSYFQENPQIIRAITNAGVEGLALRMQTAFFRDFFEKRFGEKQVISLYDVSYYSGAIFSVLILWNQENYQKPLTELVAQTSKIMSKELENYPDTNH